MQIKLTMQIKLLFFTLTAFILLPHVALAQVEQGERPIVRMVYLSGGNPQPNIDAKLDTLIKDTQQFFADQMEAHGFKRKTFLYETDAHGKAVVHHERKNFPRSDYELSLYESNEFLPFAGLHACGVAWTSSDAIGGHAEIVSNCFTVTTFAHELGHLFGLPHDYRTSGTWIPSHPSHGEKMVTSFAAAQWLDVHPAFNTGGNFTNRNTTIKMLPPSLVSPSNAIRLRFEVTDPDGLHQAQLTSRAIDRFPALLDYEGLNGSTDSTLEFIIPDPAIFAGNTFDVSLRVIDMQGNILESFRYYVNTTLLLPPSEVLSGLDSHSEVRVQHRIGERRSQYTTWGLPEGAIARLGKGSINQVAYSPDGRRLAVAGDAGILLYDTRTYQEVSFFTDTGHGSIGYSVSFSPDGKTLASADYSSISLWRVETGQRLRTLTAPDLPDLVVTCVAFSPDGKTLASNGNDIHLWDVDTGNLLHTLVRKRSGASHAIQGVSPLRVVFSPDGKTLASTTINPLDLLQLWDVETGDLLHTLEHENFFTDIAFSPDGKMIASAIGGRDERILYFWDVETGQRLRTFTEHGYNINSIAFSPDGQTLAIGSSYTIQGDDGGDLTLWDLDTGTLLHTLVGHSYYIIDVAFSPDGQTLTSASGEGTLRFWNVETGQLLYTANDHTANITDVAFSPDGRRLVTVSGDYHAGTDYTIRLWDIGTRSLLYTMTGHPFYSVDFSPDGQILASGSHDGAIGLWDINTGRLLRTLTGHAGTVKTLFSPDGQILASGSYDGVIGLWDINTGRLLRTLHRNLPILDISFSPDGSMIASVVSRGFRNENVDNLQLWDVDTGTPLDPALGWSHPTHNIRGMGFSRIDFSPDGKILAAGSSNWVHLWDVETRSSLHTFGVINFSGQHFGQRSGGFFQDVAFSPDGKTLAAFVSRTGGVSPHIRLWDVDTGTRLRTLTGHNAGMGQQPPIAFSPDGQTLASGHDGTVLLWDLVPTPPEPARVTADVNGDGEVNIQDLVAVAAALGQTGENDADVNGDDEVNIQDLVAVAAAIGEVAAAPAALRQQDAAHLTQENVEHWLTQAQQADLTDATSVRGIRYLEQLLLAFIPKETALLPNYPNPFNPETWIPYQLATRADVTLTIYDIQGRVVRDLDLGHQRAGMYQSKSRAAYWDGRNAAGEPVASGVYFYTLSTESTRDSVTAGGFTATRKMLIRK